MSARLLKQNHLSATCCAVALARGNSDRPGILCLQDLVGAPERGASLLSLILFDLQRQATAAVVTCSGMGPDRLSRLATDALQSRLWYSRRFAGWRAARGNEA
jgi:hypothetical protein